MRARFFRAGVPSWARILRRRLWILVVCVIALPAAVYVMAVRQPKAYEARVILETERTPSSRLIGNVYVADPESGALALAQIGTPELIQATATRLGRPYSSIGAPGAGVDARTGWLTLVAGGPSAQTAMTTANALASVLRERLRQVGREGLDSAVAEIRRSRDAVSDPQSREQLDAALKQLRAEQLSTPTILPVVERADQAQVVAPHPRRDATLAVILALLLAPGLMLVADRLDTRIRRTDTLADLAGAPVLTTLPAGRSARPGGSTSATEAVARLRDNLAHVQRDARLDVIAIASGLPREGRTTVAVELALAFARAGQRVGLVDADLRGGDVARRLGVPPAPGLTDVLQGSDLDEALLPAGPPDAPLLVLPSGSSVTHAGELLGSARMSSVLELAASRSEIVVIDTAPLLRVSDALALLGQTSGVVAVAQLGRTRRDALVRLIRVVRSARGRLLGVVATGDVADDAAAAEPPQRTNVPSIRNLPHEQGASR